MSALVSHCTYPATASGRKVEEIKLVPNLMLRPPSCGIVYRNSEGSRHLLGVKLPRASPADVESASSPDSKRCSTNPIMDWAVVSGFRNRSIALDDAAAIDLPLELF